MIIDKVTIYLRSGKGGQGCSTLTSLSSRKIIADGGELLLKTPGVSGVKMGNHGVDPVIRGQKHNQLNILLDGAYDALEKL